MANNPLNLYATKVFEEHPKALWALDESVGYLALGNQPDFSSLGMWYVEGGSKITADEFESVVPFIPSYDLDLQPIYIQGADSGSITLDAPDRIQETDVNPEQGSVAVGAYVYAPDRSIEVIATLSYTNDDLESERIRSVRVDPIANVPARSRKMWAFVSFTFELPESFTDLEVRFEISYEASEVPFQVAMFGVTVGQWAEEFQSTELGAVSFPIPSEIPLDNPNLQVIQASAYGVQENPGYYVVKDNMLLAKNSGMPLVFGSDSSTTLYPADSTPSLILPGLGFLNQSGTNKEMTFESWLNIQSDAVADRRIFGPLTSSDGLYVDRHLLKMKVGSEESSFYVGEWGRPMLVSIRSGRSSVSIVVNGEQVMSLPIDTRNFPDATEDWLGFFLYEDVPIVNIESPAIYPYEVPAIVQKRRFVYGQGVEFPTSIKGLNHTSIISFDNSVANSAKNVRYPETRSWSSGTSENINAEQSGLSLPEYKAPSLYLNDNSVDWLDAMNAGFDNNDPSFGFRSSDLPEDLDGYLYFENIAFMNETPFAFFGLFENTDAPEGKQTLMQLKNNITAELLEIYINESSIVYALDDNIFYSEDLPEIQEEFVAGIDFIKAQSFGGNIASFVSNVQSLSMFLGGTGDYSNTFTGKIKRLSFSSKNNLTKFDELFESNGLADSSASQIAKSGNASYSLVPRISLAGFLLDVATSSSWQDYVPVSYFAKKVLDSTDNLYESVDFLQFNVDYVKLNNFVDNQYFAENMPVRTYIAFEYLSNGVTPDRDQVVPLEKLGVVTPGDEWTTSRYEVFNDTIIKFPIGEDRTTLALVIYVEIESDGVLSDNISIRYLDISSQALGNQPNKIGTQFGAKVIPYKRSGLYFDYKSVSPFSISKDSSPYLHLTKYSGMRSRIPLTHAGLEGISIPINPNRESFFKIDLFQMSFKYDEPDFPVSPVQLFELQSEVDYIRFYVVSDSNTRKRGQIYAIDSNTGTIRSDIVFFVNGRPTRRPILNPRSWSTVSFSFLNSISFARYTGAFRVTSPILFDNVSYYQASQLDEVQRFSFRKWSAVRSGLDTTLAWEDWEDSTWQEVLYLAESDSELSDAENIYKTYTGTNSFIFDSSSTLVLNNYKSSIYKDLEWNSSVIIPV